MPHYEPELVLVFLTGGQCVFEEDDEVVWSSDDDTTFRERFPNEFLNPEEAEPILRYLLECELLDEEELPAVEIEVESLEEDDGSGDDGDSSEDEALQ